ncbi:MAG: beta-lactamase family protein [Deltaproteobacteria bacterium]|nr:beta-lactamase family protein [Deltaproteobacteria bacterium]MBN2674725.1 beta-lactamase family protein [Deltaproteobacteria bacterium]
MPSPLPLPAHVVNKRLSDALQQGIDEHVFSGAQAAWCVDGGEIHLLSSGYTRYKGGIAITQHTRFDIASLTKLFTATIALHLVDAKKLSLDSIMWSDHTLETLLSHESGLPAWKPFFEYIPVQERGSLEACNQIIAMVLGTEKETISSDSAVYSDLGFIGLGHHLEQITNVPFKDLVADIITQPLGMARTCFGVDLSPSETDIAATENCPWRGRILQGEVHDDNAWAMGGIAGHAGLFSTAEEMVTFGEAWRAALTTDGIVHSTLANLAVTRRHQGRGLGFDIKTPGASSIGNTADKRTFGHLGFTGTSLWIDPTRAAVICLLTNRVHPTRENNRIRDFRPYFHELFFSAV